MKNKTTEQLLNSIKENSNAHEYFSENEGELTELSLSGYLNSMLEKYSLSKAELFRRAGLNGNNYGYELFRSDAKTPSRDILFRLCLSFPLTIDETQAALRNAGLALLYPRSRRDAYMLFALKNHQSVDELNDLLSEKKQKLV